LLKNDENGLLPFGSNLKILTSRSLMRNLGL